MFPNMIYNSSNLHHNTNTSTANYNTQLNFHHGMNVGSCSSGSGSSCDNALSKVGHIHAKKLKTKSSKQRNTSLSESKTSNLSTTKLLPLINSQNLNGHSSHTLPPPIMNTISQEYYTNSNNNNNNNTNNSDSLKTLISSYMNLNTTQAAAAYAAAAAALTNTNSYLWNLSFNQYCSTNQFSQRYSNSFVPMSSSPLSSSKPEAKSNFYADKVAFVIESLIKKKLYLKKKYFCSFIEIWWQSVGIKKLGKVNDIEHVFKCTFRLFRIVFSHG